MTKLPAVVSIRVRKTAGACEAWNKGKANRTASRSFIRSSVARLSCDSWASTQAIPIACGNSEARYSQWFDADGNLRPQQLDVPDYDPTCGRPPSYWRRPTTLGQRGGLTPESTS